MPNPSTLTQLYTDGDAVSKANPLPIYDPALLAEIERLRLQVSALVQAVTALTEKLSV